MCPHFDRSLHVSGVADARAVHRSLCGAQDGSGSITYDELLSNLTEGKKANALARLEASSALMSSVQRKREEARAIEELEMHKVMEATFDRLTKALRPGSKRRPLLAVLLSAGEDTTAMYCSC